MIYIYCTKLALIILPKIVVRKKAYLPLNAATPLMNIFNQGKKPGWPYCCSWFWQILFYITF